MACRCDWPAARKSRALRGCFRSLCGGRKVAIQCPVQQVKPHCLVFVSRESPTCEVPPFPHVATLPDRKLELYDTVSVCAQHKSPQEVFRWLTAVEGLKVHRREITDPGPGFALLDRTVA